MEITYYGKTRNVCFSFISDFVFHLGRMFSSHRVFLHNNCSFWEMFFIEVFHTSVCYLQK